VYSAVSTTFPCLHCAVNYWNGFNPMLKILKIWITIIGFLGPEILGLPILTWFDVNKNEVLTLLLCRWN
jgi:hypothetical protein